MLRFDYLGLRAEISTQNEAFSTYLMDNYGQFVSEGIQSHGKEPEIKLDIEFANAGEARVNHWLEKARKANPITLGTSLNAGNNSVFYHYGPCLIRASRVNDSLRVSALFVKTRRFRGSIVMDRTQWPMAFQTLMRLCVHFPMFSLLQERGFSVLHASAVAKDGDAVLFFGLNGAGKTTSALALTPELTLIADNFLLSDGDFVYGFPETTRISPETARAFQIESSGVEIYDKFQISNTLSPDNIKAKAVMAIICRRGKEMRWEELDRESFLTYVEAADRFLHETHAYSYLTFLTKRKSADRYPECPYNMITINDFQTLRQTILERIGGLYGL